MTIRIPRLRRKPRCEQLNRNMPVYVPSRQYNPSRLAALEALADAAATVNSTVPPTAPSTGATSSSPTASSTSPLTAAMAVDDYDDDLDGEDDDGTAAAPPPGRKRKAPAAHRTPAMRRSAIRRSSAATQHRSPTTHQQLQHQHQRSPPPHRRLLPLLPVPTPPTLTPQAPALPPHARPRPYMMRPPSPAVMDLDLPPLRPGNAPPPALPTMQAPPQAPTLPALRAAPLPLSPPAAAAPPHHHHHQHHEHQLHHHHGPPSMMAAPSAAPMVSPPNLPMHYAHMPAGIPAPPGWPQGMPPPPMMMSGGMPMMMPPMMPPRMPPVPALHAMRPLLTDPLVTASSVAQGGAERDILHLLRLEQHPPPPPAAEVGGGGQAQGQGQGPGPAAPLQQSVLIGGSTTPDRNSHNRSTNNSSPALDGLEYFEPEDIGERGVPRLQRVRHTRFVRAALMARFPHAFVGLDASRPWLMYWGVSALSVLGSDVTEHRERLMHSLVPAQHARGGFGGGYGQLPHLATTYAAVLALASVGGNALDIINRRKMWRWLGRMKQLDGGFTVCQGGEEDIRAAYCAMTIICLLNLPLGLPRGSPARVRGDETFLTRLPQWISRCQTFEGGLADAPGHEAHGAYAFCGLACLAILGPPKTISRYLDVGRLIRWCSAQQRAPEAGFSGRTNKLVDGCYSHWVGACWSLLHTAVAASSASPAPGGGGGGGAAAELWSRDGLVRYVLSCCQNPRGGLRDKPGKPPDAYHSCYVLAGLAAAQHVYEYRPGGASGAPAAAVEDVGDGGDDIGTPLLSAFKWRVTDTRAGCWTEDDVVEPVHPVFVIAMDKVEEVRVRYDRERNGGF